MLRRISVVVLLFCSVNLARAEQLRIAVAQPEIVASTAEAREQAAGYAALWQSLLSLELTRRDLFAVVEREEMPRTLREWEMTVSQSAQTNRLIPAWLSADCVIIGKLAVTNEQYSLSTRLLNTDRGAIEKEWTQAFATSAIEQQARALVQQLQQLGLAMLATRNVHTLASVMDFENLGPFDRSRWLESTLARRISSLLRRQPGVLLLEREDVNALFDEVRLQHGGLTAGKNEPTNRWASLRNRFQISGQINESQPDGQPLTFSVVVQIRNLSTAGLQRVEQKFFASEIEAGLTRLEAKVIAAVQADAPTRGDEPGRATEALELANQAVRLMKLPEFTSVAIIDRFSWELPPHAFSEARHPFDNSPRRRADVLHAVQDLKAAQMLDEQNARIKVFLSSLLADRSVQETNLAVELAEEIGWQHPQFQSRAWWFVFKHSSGEKRSYYRQRLMDDFSGTWVAKQAASSAMQELVEKYQDVSDLGGSVDEFRALMDRSLSWGGDIEGEVMHLFQLTQITGRNPAQRQKRYELRDAKDRQRGAQIIEEMIQQYPQHAFYLAHFWTYYWDYYTDEQEVIDTWIRRTSDLALKTDRDPWVIGVRVDPLRIQLARRLMDRGQHREALGYLELVSNYHSVSAATFMIGECAFALGEYERALKQFQTFGADHRDVARYHKEAVTWADKCRAKLQIPSEPSAAPAYIATDAKWAWKTAAFSLPRGTVSDLKADGTELWIGVKNNGIWSDQNVITLESNPTRMAEALRQGGLLRVHPQSGRVTAFEVGKTISHPWVTCLAVADGKVFVGTYGKGVDVFDKATGQWSNMNERGGLLSDFVQCMDADEESLWVGTGRFERGGVARFRFKTRQWQSYLPGDYPSGPPPRLPVRCMKLVAGRLWCAVPGAIYGYNIQANRWSLRRSSNHFTSIASGAGRIWFGADQFNPPGPLCGLVHCDLNGEDWQTLREVDGLPDIAVTAMADSGDKLLLGTYGFMVLDPLKKTFTTSELRKVNPASSYVVSALLVAHGRLWMASRDDARLRYVDWRVP